MTVDQESRRMQSQDSGNDSQIISQSDDHNYEDNENEHDTGNTNPDNETADTINGENEFHLQPGNTRLHMYSYLK